MFVNLFKGIFLSTLAVSLSILLWSNFTINFIGFSVSLLSVTFGLLSSAISEEILFRFIIFELLIKRCRFEIALIIESLIFSLAHYTTSVDLIALIGYFLGGVNYTLAYVLLKKTSKIYSQSMRLLKKISLPIGLHLGWNCSQSILFGLKTENYGYKTSIFSVDLLGEDLFTGGNYGYEGGLIQLIARILVLLYLLYVFTKQN